MIPEDDVPIVIAESVMYVQGHAVKVMVLSDGKRIVDAEDAKRLMRELLGIELLGDVAARHVSTGPKP